jgi:hypothetical protein
VTQLATDIKRRGMARLAAEQNPPLMSEFRLSPGAEA